VLTKPIDSSLDPRASQKFMAYSFNASNSGASNNFAAHETTPLVGVRRPKLPKPVTRILRDINEVNNASCELINKASSSHAPNCLEERSSSYIKKSKKERFPTHYWEPRNDKFYTDYSTAKKSRSNSYVYTLSAKSHSENSKYLLSDAKSLKSSGLSFLSADKNLRDLNQINLSKNNLNLTNFDSNHSYIIETPLGGTATTGVLNVYKSSQSN